MRKPITSYNMNIYKINLENLIPVNTKLDISFKRITLDNVKEVAILRNNTRLYKFKKLIKQNKSFGIAAYYKGEVVGYGWIKWKGCKDRFFHIKNRQGYLSSFFVEESMRGNRIYPCIIQKLIVQFNELYNIDNFSIAIQEQNYASISGVKKMGFYYNRRIDLYRVLKVTIPKYSI